ncbi:MAG: hypothetical protein Q7S56_03945 [Nanoarchaeota archaeon]|nr:hypothetical protein [Nanoarchaeota archaeon]
MTKRSSSHYKALEYLAEHPEYIGIDPRDVSTVSVEQVLFHRGKFYCKIDLVYELNTGKAVIIEYKSNGHKELIEKGESQLERAVEFYQKIMKIPAEGRLITGDSYPQLKRGRKKPLNFETKSKNK